MCVLNKVGLTAILTTAMVPTAIGQRPVDPVTEVTRFNVSTGYQYIKANAPPGGCKCFGLNGGYVSGGLQFNQWLGVEAEFTGSHANNISLLGQNLALMTYRAGPRASLHRRRLTLFGEALLGGAHGSDSYFPSGSTYSATATSFAYSAGGGVEYNLTPRYAIRLIQGDYLHTAFPNGETNGQSHLALGAGIVIKFRGRRAEAAPVAVVTPNKVASLACSAKSSQVDEGQVVEVSGKATTLRSQGEVDYSWTTSGGTIQGTGRRVTIDTRGVASGNYIVTGRAVLDGDSDGSDCELSFHVTRKIEPPPPPLVQTVEPAPPASAVAAKAEHVFHENVQDALFDYDKWAIRPDTQAAIIHAAAYLIEHPEIRVVVGGYSDERGTAEYNIALGLKRANATRDALVLAGVNGDRIQVISYGKGAQVCAAETEECWQQNRRAAFSLHP